MPSPIGHALGGVGIAWSAELLTRRAVSTRVTIACAAAAVSADIDLVLPMPHRTVTHSLTAVACVIVAAAVTGWVTGRRAHPMLFGAAYGSHLLLDWLAVDRSFPFGIQALWPFSARWFYSGVDLFPATERQYFFTAASFATNARAIGLELLIFAPLMLALWLFRRRSSCLG